MVLFASTASTASTTSTTLSKESKCLVSLLYKPKIARGLSFVIFFILLGSVFSEKLLSSTLGGDENEEIWIPVDLWDNDLQTVQDSSEFAGLARYLVANVSVGQQHHQIITLDLGNAEESMLLLDMCLGCTVKSSSLQEIQGQATNGSMGCPAVVPSCHHHHRHSKKAGFCFPSHPQGYLPHGTYKPIQNQHQQHQKYSVSPKNSSCPPGTVYAGTISIPTTASSVVVPVCSQCFGCSSHSRFYILILLIHGLSFNAHNHHHNTPKLSLPLQLGGLIRTVPHIDRPWANFGIGYKSSILRQLNVSSLWMQLDPPIRRDDHPNDHDYGRFVLFNPKPHRYHNWPSLPYQLEQQQHSQRRIHDHVSFRIIRFPPISSHNDPKTIQSSKNLISSKRFMMETTNSSFSTSKTNHHFLLWNHTFHIDSGNSGISVSDLSLQLFLANITGGSWMSVNTSQAIQSSALDHEPSLVCPGNSTRRLYIPRKFIDMAQQQQTNKSAQANVKNTDAPELQVLFRYETTKDDVVTVTIPPSSWILHYAHHYPNNGDTTTISRKNHHYHSLVPTIFVTYSKNVLGLPFIRATGGLVYNDHHHRVYFRNGRNVL